MARQGSHSSKKRGSVAEPSSSKVDAVIGPLGTVANVVGQAIMVGEWVLPVLGGAVGFLGFKRAKGVLNKPKDILQNTKVGAGTLSNAMLDGSFAVGSGIEMFGVARSYSQKMDSLKDMYTDMTGRKASQMSSDKHLPKAVAEAQAHVFKEHSIRGVLSSLGGALSLRSLLKGGSGTKTMIAWMVLPFASEGVNMLMGEAPVLHIYKGIADAHKRGEQIPAQTYAEFVLTASNDLQTRGASGKELAGKLAEQYAAVNAAPAAILNEVENGRMMQRIKVIVENGEVELPTQPQKINHAQALDGKQEQKVLGPETAKVVGRREGIEPSPALGA